MLAVYTRNSQRGETKTVPYPLEVNSIVRGSPRAQVPRSRECRSAYAGWNAQAGPGSFHSRSILKHSSCMRRRARVISSGYLSRARARAQKGVPRAGAGGGERGWSGATSRRVLFALFIRPTSIAVFIIGRARSTAVITHRYPS